MPKCISIEDLLQCIFSSSPTFKKCSIRIKSGINKKISLLFLKTRKYKPQVGKIFGFFSIPLIQWIIVVIT